MCVCVLPCGIHNRILRPGSRRITMTPVAFGRLNVTDLLLLDAGTVARAYQGVNGFDVTLAHSHVGYEWAPGSINAVQASRPALIMSIISSFPQHFSHPFTGRSFSGCGKRSELCRGISQQWRRKVASFFCRMLFPNKCYFKNTCKISHVLSFKWSIYTNNMPLWIQTIP